MQAIVLMKKNAINFVAVVRSLHTVATYLCNGYNTAASTNATLFQKTFICIGHHTLCSYIVNI